MRPQFDGFAFQINQKQAFEHEKELIFLVVFYIAPVRTSERR